MGLLTLSTCLVPLPWAKSPRIWWLSSLNLPERTFILKVYVDGVANQMGSVVGLVLEGIY